MESSKDSTTHHGSGPQEQGSMSSTTECSGTTHPRFDVITARYRAAWPELRPNDGVEVSKAPLPSFIVPHVSTIEEKAREILAQYQIKFEDEEEDEVEVQIVDQGHYTERIPTLRIVAPWSVDKQEDWKNAVHDMAEFIYKFSQEAKFDHTKVHVDMKDPKLTKIIYCHPVEESFCDTAEWDTIRKVVRQRLNAFKATKGKVSVIMLLRYGVLEQREANPVTIFIGCFADSDETGWLKVIEDIQMNIAEHGWTDVYIHIEHSWAESLIDDFG
ncbi:hypothetical protein NW768_008265 [Fusarium equiseti]|uniref:Uncharacterized protein n=1 Tax=Fusarium equiseti TaxID=61235 RepID=A0ABQ8R6R0_FUSEQ|nr:hypothetical protein NW768_008265 [Fusarium equiseti]